MIDVQLYRQQIDCLEGKLVNGFITILVRMLGSWSDATSCSEDCSCEVGG